MKKYKLGIYGMTIWTYDEPLCLFGGLHNGVGARAIMEEACDELNALAEQGLA